MSDTDARRVSPPSGSGWRELPAPLFASVLVFVLGLVWWPFTVDDTFITLRYAHHVAVGQGPVFTPGERVEGFSSPAHVYLLAWIEHLGFDPLASAKVLGIASAVVLVWWFHAAARRLGVGRVPAGAATVGLGTIPAFGLYGASGLETNLYALATLAAATSSGTGSKLGPVIGSVWLSAVLIATGTLRPEGIAVVLVLAVLGLRWADRPHERLAIFAAVVVLGLLLLSRVVWFGTLAPNTFVAKPSPWFGFLSHPTEPTNLKMLPLPLLRNLAPGLTRLGGLWVMILVTLPFLTGRPDRAQVRVAAVAVVGICFAMYAPGDWMPESRFLTPAMAPLLLLAVVGYTRLARLFPSEQGRRFALISAGLAVAGMALNLGGGEELLRSYRSGRANPALDARRYQEIGRWLRANASPGASLMSGEVGAVGYESGLRIVDHEGLVDPEIARVVRRAGGYGAIRNGANAEAMRALVEACRRADPDWFMVRCSNALPLVVGDALRRESVKERIQQALLDEVGGAMRIRAAFRLGDPSDFYVLLGPPAAAVPAGSPHGPSSHVETPRAVVVE